MTVEQVQALLDTGPTYTRCVQGVCHETLLLLRTAAALNTRTPATYWPIMRAASRMQVKRNILHVSLENKYATDKKPQSRTKDHRHGRKTTECLHLTQKCLHRLRSLACVLKDDKILCSALSLARFLFATLCPSPPHPLPLSLHANTHAPLMACALYHSREPQRGAGAQDQDFWHQQDILCQSCPRPSKRRMTS